MPGVWCALKKLLPCKFMASNVHENFHDNGDSIQRKIPKRSVSLGCLANLQNVIHGSVRPSFCSSKFEEISVEISDPVTRNGIILNNPRLSLGVCANRVAEFERQGVRMLDCELERLLSRKDGAGGTSSSVCQICEAKYKRSTATESHSLSKHSVTELMEGESSRKIVEIICQTGKKEDTVNNKCPEIKRILKINNMQNTLARFEDYREMVKTKASKQSDHKENPRCLADGNELLRFYATTILCSLGKNGLKSLCRSVDCGACRILRNGFFTEKDSLGRVGIFATSNSERALRYACAHEGPLNRKVLFVCRVIAGKIHSPVRKLEQGFRVGSRFDSLAWKVGQTNNAEELFLLNTAALLPCFAVIYKI